MKRIIKKFFRLFGLEIRKIESPDQSKLQDNVFGLRSTMKESLQQVLSTGYYPDVVIDVGTASGTPPLLECFPKSEFVFVEPLKEFEAAIRELLKKYKGSYYQAVAGDKKGKAVINVHPDKVGSSTYKEVDGAEVDGIPREVDVIALDDFARAFKGKKVLLKIDVQGAEIDVLKGAKELVLLCDVIILEVSFFRFLISAPDFYETVSYMKSEGFVAYDLFDGHNRPLDLALAQKDILFVKESGVFRKSHHWGTEEQRKMMRNVIGGSLPDTNFEKHSPSLD